MLSTCWIVCTGIADQRTVRDWTSSETMRTMGTAVGSSAIVAPRRERTPFTTPLVTGSSEENESVRSVRSS